MKKNIIMILTFLLIIILIIFIGYQIYNRKLETSQLIYENKIMSGDSFIDELKMEEDIIFSGDIINSGETEKENIEATLGVQDTVKTDQNQLTKQQVTSSKNSQKLTSTTPYYIKVNNLQNVVTIYQKDSDGNYTIPYKAMLCSIGSATPDAGKMYKITSYKKRWNALQGNVYGQYATQIVGNILFHSVPYTDKNNASLEYWEYDKLGTDASLGCVRLTVADAKWIYDNISQGTIVEFYEDSNPGPLGKPAAKKISNNEVCRNWDPTDTVEGNPWNRVETIQKEEEIITLEEDSSDINFFIENNENVEKYVSGES